MSMLFVFTSVYICSVLKQVWYCSCYVFRQCSKILRELKWLVFIKIIRTLLFVLIMSVVF